MEVPVIMLRRSLLKTFCFAPVAAVQSFGQAPERQRKYDILIKNGEVHDPSRKIRQKADLAVLDGKIAAIEPDIPAAQGLDVIDARGLFVTPGLVDLHTHCAHDMTDLSVEAEPIAARSGVTTWVDAGSFGPDQVRGFVRFIVAPAEVRKFGFVHLYANFRNPDVNIVETVRRTKKQTAAAVLDHHDSVLGVKVYLGTNMNGRYSLDFLKIARELGDEFKFPIMAHISYAPPQTPEVMELMRGGDIVTHCLNAHSLGILEKTDPREQVFSSTGKLKAGVREARARGVLFDVGHGAGSFNFGAAKAALDSGFVPDTISTDIYAASINGPVFDMPTTMSKMLHLGMSFDDILLRVTANPAKIINRVSGLGTLGIGAPADIALLDIEEGQFQLVDSQRNMVTASKRIVSRLTICRGKRVTAPL
jgi:dihydroorotase